MTTLINVHLHFFGSLNDFLPFVRRNQEFELEIAPHQTVKDVIESVGVPHSEIDLLLKNGNTISFAERLQTGAKVEAYPVNHPITKNHTSLVRLETFLPCQFLLDVNLGRLASYLRLCGIDSEWKNHWLDKEIAELSVQTKRVLLTRDVKLLMRKTITHGYWVRAVQPREQLVEVLRRFQLYPALTPFIRCSHCNSLLEQVSQEKVWERLEPKTKLFYSEFSLCPGCDRIYWRGSHHEKMKQFFQGVLAENRAQ
jgi:uncharacterized protein